MTAFTNAAGQVSELINLSQANLLPTILIVGFFWVVHIANRLTHFELNQFGIYPRHPAGLIGLIFSPFLHANFEHLLFNTIPLLILVNLMLLQGYPVFIGVTLFIMIISGFAVWLLGRTAIHIGASGLIMGYWGFLLAQAVIMPTILVVIIAIVCLYYLGGLATSIVPSANREVSWEAHLFGCLSGIGAAYLLYHFPIFDEYLINLIHFH